MLAAVNWGCVRLKRIPLQPGLESFCRKWAARIISRKKFVDCFLLCR